MGVLSTNSLFGKATLQEVTQASPSQIKERRKSQRRLSRENRRNSNGSVISEAEVSQLQAVGIADGGSNHNRRSSKILDGSAHSKSASMHGQTAVDKDPEAKREPQALPPLPRPPSASGAALTVLEPASEPASEPPAAAVDPPAQAELSLDLAIEVSHKASEVTPGRNYHIVEKGTRSYHQDPVTKELKQVENDDVLAAWELAEAQYQADLRQAALEMQSSPTWSISTAGGASPRTGNEDTTTPSSASVSSPFAGMDEADKQGSSNSFDSEEDNLFSCPEVVIKAVMWGMIRNVEKRAEKGQLVPERTVSFKEEEAPAPAESPEASPIPIPKSVKQLGLGTVAAKGKVQRQNKGMYANKVKYVTGATVPRQRPEMEDSDEEWEPEPPAEKKQASPEKKSPEKADRPVSLARRIWRGLFASKPTEASTLNEAVKEPLNEEPQDTKDNMVTPPASVFGDTASDAGKGTASHPPRRPSLITRKFSNMMLKKEKAPKGQGAAAADFEPCTPEVLVEAVK
ncbi:unnamed protein product [Chrysoparadoxa australica]